MNRRTDPLVTDEEIEQLNRRVEKEHELIELTWRYARSEVGAIYLAIVDEDDENAHKGDVPAQMARNDPWRTIAIAKRMWDRGYEHGERWGRWSAQSEMRRALGIETAFLQLEADQKAAADRARYDAPSPGAR